MVQLRPLTLLVLIALPPVVAVAVTAGFTSEYYGRKIERLAEERKIYATLADSALGLSDRAFIFAHGYQETLDICLSRIYAPTAMAAELAAPTSRKGGLGGPSTVREQSRLP